MQTGGYARTVERIRGVHSRFKAGNQWLIQRKDVEQFVPHPGGKPKKKARRRKGL
jgi:hypothetical protein